MVGTGGAQVTRGLVNVGRGVRTADLNHRGRSSVSSWVDLQPHGWPKLPSWCGNLCPLFFSPKDLEGVPPSKKMKLEASQQSSEEM